MNKIDLNKKLLEAQSIEEQELINKNREIEKDRIETRHSELQKRKELENKFSSIDLGDRNQDRIKALQEENLNYFTSARKSKVFLNDDFDGKVPYFERNVILLTGLTGDGKSTTCANLAFHAIAQGQKALVISNEEYSSDIYNRVACLCMGRPYTDHSNFSDQDIFKFNQMIEIMSHRLTVIDDSYGGDLGQTSTIEGMKAIFSSIIKNKSNFDVIIIDYYQNVSSSTKVPSKKDWEVQSEFAKFLDSVKNLVHAPIILLAQKKPNSEKISFKESIEGRKLILNTATCAIEMKADRENLKTDWTIHKSRFTNAVGETISTGFKHGRFVKYDDKFINEVETIKIEKATRGYRSKILSKEVVIEEE